MKIRGVTLQNSYGQPFLLEFPADVTKNELLEYIVYSSKWGFQLWSTL